MVERRRAERFEMELSARVWAGKGGKGPLELLTADVSAYGAFFETNSPLPSGTRVRVEVVVPLSESVTTIQVSGTVVRADTEGMAIRFDRDFEMSKCG